MTDYGNPVPMPSPDYGTPDANGFTPVEVDIDTTPDEASDLDILRAELAKTHAIPDITYPVKAHQGWSVILDPNFKARDLAQWQRKATDKAGRTDTALLAGLIVAARCKAITVNGRRLTDDKGNPLKIAHPDMLTMTDAPTAAAAAAAFFLHDADLIHAGNALVSAAGYDEAGDPEDPTE